jgi:uncharacterized membrane protein
VSWRPRERAPAVLLACLGLAISAYLTIVHFSQGQVSLACPAGGTVNCERVTTSAGSMVGPIPVAALGVLWFLVALLLGLRADRPGSTRSLRAALVWSALGLVSAFYLIYVELFVVGAICLWCTAVHLLIFGLFLLAVRRAEVEGLA